MMYVIGITGGTGCGKTTALERRRRHGGLVIDCDAVYHRLLDTDPALTQAIAGRFDGVTENGRIDRRRLGQRVFADPQALEALNTLTHGFVRREVERLLQAARQEGRPFAAIDAIGLFESGLDTLCDITVAVTAPLEARVARRMARDGISEDYARSRLAAQHNEDWFRRRCDYILENNASAADFLKKSVAFLDAQGIM